MSQNTQQKSSNNSVDGKDVKDNDDNNSDMLTSIEQGFEKIHNSVQQSTPSYTQSISDLQQESLMAWKNLVCSTISIQRQYAEKIGLQIGSVEVTSQIIQRMAEEVVRSFEMQGSTVRAFFDTSKQNFKQFNESTAMYTQWQKKFIDCHLKNPKKSK